MKQPVPKHSLIERTATGAEASASALKRARQIKRIEELRQALVNAEFRTLSQQAGALGLSRSTTWAVLQGTHKRTGLQAALVARMWTASTLPPAARKILATYLTERLAGAYGHNDHQCSRFAAQLEQLGLRTDGL